MADHQVKTARSLFAFLLALGFSLQAREAAAIDIRTDSGSFQQRFEAWGTSLAWMGNELGGSSNTSRRDQVMDLLFDQTNGLGLNFVRYNIGAGQNPSGPTITRPGADLDGWVPSAPTNLVDSSTWQWDWNADATQRLILDKALERGVSQVEAFANSAPWWMTIAQSSTGNPAGGANLDTDNYDEFTHYLLEVAEHFESNLGIHFNTLAPMNEPGAGWWTGGGSQEGMNVPLGSRQSSLIREVGMEIANRGLDIGLVGPEETSTDQTLDSWRLYGSITKSYVSQINTHTYPFNGGSGAADSAALQAAAAADGKKIYATEFGTGGNSTPLSGGIRLANQITSDLQNLKAPGWTYWQAVEDNNGSNWGLIIAPFDGNNNSFDMRRQYYAMQQFSAFIRPGAHLLDHANDETIAAYDPRTQTTTLVITNDETQTEFNQYNLLDQSAAFTRRIRTSNSENYKALGPASVTGNALTMSALGESITTLVIHHQPNLIQNASFERGFQPNGSNQIPGWQAEGGGFYNTYDNTNDSSESGALFTDNPTNSGAAYQTGIGDGETDLTGIAFQFSLDVLFQNEALASYDADTYLALEFYGADDQTLVQQSVDDYETLILPALGINSTQGTDSVFRTYRSERAIAPAGTRYVRPVIRYRNVDSSSTDWIYFDNAYLQHAHPEADAREWSATGDGTWSDNTNWMSHALVENNSRQYFGNAIEQASTVTLNSIEAINEMTFFSENGYHLQGTGGLEIGIPDTQTPALIDARLGSHTISVATELTGPANIQVLPGARLTFDEMFDLKSYAMTKLGAGILDFSAGFVMNDGKIASYAFADATISLSSDAILDGDFQLLLAPGQALQTGDLFELVTYNSLSDTFDNLLLPSLEGELIWEVSYGPDSLTVEVVIAMLNGDFNDDGIVDAADYVVWRDRLGDSTPLPNDGEISGPIGSAHYDLWLANYGSTRLANSTSYLAYDRETVSTSAPEPSSIALFGLLALLTSAYRRSV